MLSDFEIFVLLWERKNLIRFQHIVVPCGTILYVCTSVPVFGSMGAQRSTAKHGSKTEHGRWSTVEQDREWSTGARRSTSVLVLWEHRHKTEHGAGVPPSQVIALHCLSIGGPCINAYAVSADVLAQSK